jgi:rubrerythrin
LTARRPRPYNRLRAAACCDRPQPTAMSDASDTIRILRETLELERAATSRYAEHQSWANDPRLCAYWEGLRRNESDHHDTIVAELAQAGAGDQDEAAREQPAGGESAPTEPLTGAESPGPDAPLRERGYAHILATLRSDLEFERLAVEKYAAFAKQLDDRRLKALMREFVRAETGHGRGLRRTIERVSATDYPVVVYCPTCGWELDFGLDPAERPTVHCPMCAMTFALRARAGDFVLERV